MIGAIRRRRVPAGVTVAGLVLAGGRGVRMGGRDKGLVRHRGRPLVAAGLAWLSPWCQVSMISANRHLWRYAGLADLVVSDRRPDHLGPLAGIAAGLGVVRTRWLLTCPCDVPALPPGLAVRLLRALRLSAGVDVAVVRDEERLQPLVAAWRGSLGPAMNAYLESGGRSVHGFLATLNVAEVRVRGVLGNRNERAGSWERPPLWERPPGRD